MKEKGMYISNDGCLFDTKEECMEYEEIMSACEKLIGGHVITESELMELEEGDYVVNVGGKWANWGNSWDYFNAAPVSIVYKSKGNNGEWYIETRLSDGTETKVSIISLFVTPQTILMNLERRDKEKFLAKIQAKSCIYNKDDPAMRYAAAVDYIQGKRAIRDRIKADKESNK